MNGPFIEIRLALSVVFLIFIAFRIYASKKNHNRINSLISKYYQERYGTVRSIYKLNFTERLKYGGQVNPFTILIGYVTPLFSFKNNYLRKVELSDQQHRDFTKYIEVTMNRRELISVNEFDSFEI